MTVWSIQPLELYEKLCKEGKLHCDPNHEEFMGSWYPQLREAYDWMVEQMITRVWAPPPGVTFVEHNA